MSNQTTERWGSRIGVILAVAGSAVGLGNFLRFPGNASQNGGGAFLIPYFIALLLLGIPIGWAEWTMGRYGGRKGFHSAPGIMGVIGKGRLARYLGLVGVMIPLAVYFYYVLIESWTLAYAWMYARGGIGLDSGASVDAQVAASQTFFNEVTGSNQTGLMLDGTLHISVVVWLLVFALNFFFLYRGLSRGIEKFVKLAMPTMAILAVIILFRVLTLGTPDAANPDQNVLEGLGFMWNPDFRALTQFQTWLAAAGQIFFSLSVGFGVIINYSSYMRKKDDVVLSGLTSASINELFEVAFGGLITITAAVIFLGPALTASNAGSNFTLGFYTLPVVFAHMSFGNLFGAMFFFMLFLAAITSSLSMLQPTMAFIQESLGWSRKQAVMALLAITLSGSFFVVFFSENLVALNTIDFWVGTFLIFVMAGVQIIYFAWVFGLDRGIDEAHKGAYMKIPGIYRFIMKYVAPVYLIVIFVGFCWQNLPSTIAALAGDDVARWTIYLIFALLAGLAVILALGEKRWRAMGLDLDGVNPPDDELPASQG